MGLQFFSPQRPVALVSSAPTHRAERVRLSDDQITAITWEVYEFILGARPDLTFFVEDLPPEGQRAAYVGSSRAINSPQYRLNPSYQERLRMISRHRPRQVEEDSDGLEDNDKPLTPQKAKLIALFKLTGGTEFSLAACRDVEDPDIFFAEASGGHHTKEYEHKMNAATEAAKALCARCVLIDSCREIGLKLASLRGNQNHGVWGGLTEGERKAELERRDEAQSAKVSGNYI